MRAQTADLYTSVQLYSSGSISTPALMVDRQTLPSIFHELALLADSQLANFSVYKPSVIEERKKRYQKAAVMLTEWISESGDYDQKTWSELGPELEKNRAKFRKL